MTTRILRILSLVCTLALPVCAQQPPNPPPPSVEAQELAPPNPVSLQKDWWNFFKSATNEQLPDRIASFNKLITKTIADTPQESKDRLLPLAQKVESNLNAYLIARTQPVDAEPPILPTIQSYSLSELVTLSRDLRNSELLLQNDQEDFTDREKQIEAGEARLRRLWKRYNEITERSEEKLTLGLQIIDFRTSLEIAKIKQSILKTIISIDEETVKQGRQELKAAMGKVIIQDKEVEKLNRDLEAAKSNWDSEKKQLSEQEATSLARFDFTQKGERAKLKNQLLGQELTFANIEEAIAYNNLILKNVQLALISYLQSPTDEGLDTLENEAKRWRRDIAQLRQNLSEWELSIKRDIQRSEEWLSLNLDEDTVESSEISRLQEEILNLSEKSLVLLVRLQTEMQDTNFILELITGKVTESQYYLTNYWTHLKESIAHYYTKTGEVFSRPLFTIGDTLVSIGDIVQFLLILLVSFWLASLVEVAIGRVAHRGRGIRQSMIYRVKRLFKYLIFTLGIVVALSTLGFNLSNLVLIASALGVGLGFGLQNLFNNFVSGLIILFESQLKVGDFVELESGVRGEVKEINVRSTYIKTNDGIDVIVPNSEFTQGRVINWTWKEPYRRLQIEFGVSYDSDKDLVEKVVAEAVKTVPITLKKSWAPEPRVYIKEFGPSSINFICAIWVDATATKRYLYARSAYLWAIHEALMENGIKIPYPQLDLHIQDNIP
jgi:potassium efflux system protein